MSDTSSAPPNYTRELDVGPFTIKPLFGNAVIVECWRVTVDHGNGVRASSYLCIEAVPRMVNGRVSLFHAHQARLSAHLDAGRSVAVTWPGAENTTPEQCRNVMFERYSDAIAFERVYPCPSTLETSTPMP